MPQPMPEQDQVLTAAINDLEIKRFAACRDATSVIASVTAPSSRRLWLATRWQVR
jgi:hypothetical protein